MPISQAMPTSFKQQLLEGVHDFRASGGDTFKVALYTNAANLGASTTAYTATGEASGAGYSAGGATLSAVNPSTSGTTALTDFADVTFSGATITARGALIYNTTPGHTYTNAAVAVLDFGSDRTSTAGDFTIVFPAADASNAIIRIA
ncbi:hypothetical protein UFOVP421_41 [uncultured Caudovirales phage]|uniref:Uncharacterized protein n=1 Tax=uncultured Caudovirales phage TaxID=2100421 RepID=A0A6J5M9Q9_9CAUD|nr:hypothetical protein UFOVP421_41 [uncultured Caudovirales phage]